MFTKCIKFIVFMPLCLVIGAWYVIRNAPITATMRQIPNYMVWKTLSMTMDQYFFFTENAYSWKASRCLSTIVLSVDTNFTNVWADEYWGVTNNILKFILILILHKLENWKESEIRPLIQGYYIPSKSVHHMMLAMVLTNYIYPFRVQFMITCS